MKTASILAATVALVACGGTAPTTPFDPGRFAGLPAGVDALIDLADQLVARTGQPPAEAVRSLDRAVAALERASRQASPRQFEALWKLARACFLICGVLTSKARMEHYARLGRDTAALAAIHNSKRVEPHYYRALCLGRLAEATNKLKQVQYMIEDARMAANIDPTFDDAGPLRFLGKVYITAPAWPVSVGSPEKAIEYLRQAVTIAPVPLNRLFLGEALFHDEEYEEAAAHLRQALTEGQRTGMDPRWQKEGAAYLRRIDFRSATSPNQENPLPVVPGDPAMTEDRE